MAPIKVCVSLWDYPAPIRAHLAKRISERHVSEQSANEMKGWLETRPDAPDLNEAPQGWYKPLPSCIVLGEGEYVKTIFTTQVPRKGSVNLDTWKPSPATDTVGNMPTPDERLKAIEEQLNDIKIALAHTFELVTEPDERKKSTIRGALMQLLKNKLRPR